MKGFEIVLNPLYSKSVFIGTMTVYSILSFMDRYFSLMSKYHDRTRGLDINIVCIDGLICL